jgi:hypothetical protein
MSSHRVLEAVQVVGVGDELGACRQTTGHVSRQTGLLAEENNATVQTLNCGTVCVPWWLTTLQFDAKQSKPGTKR